MKSFLLIAVLVSFSHLSNAQSHDYASLRPSLGLLSCGFTDSVAIRKNYQRLLAVDTAFYNRHLSSYLSDLAMANYKMYAITNDKKYLEANASLLERAQMKEPKNFGIRWNYLSALYLLKRCADADVQLSYYLQHAPKMEIDTAQVRMIRAHCK